MRRMRGSSPGWLTTDVTQWRPEAWLEEEERYFENSFSFPSSAVLHNCSCKVHILCKICDIRIVSSVKD